MARKRGGSAGRIRIGVGGWTFEPWRGTFYPDGLAQAKELHFASRALTSIEINGTYYSSFKPASWRKWHDETPDDFVFAVKASRYCTNRKVLAEAGPSVEKFLAQGITELGAKLGPINWQFMATKRYDEQDFAAFLALLPKERDGVALRHAVEVRHDSFAVPAFYKLARDHGVAIVVADDAEFPHIDERTSGFTYARLMTTSEREAAGVSATEVRALAKRAGEWAKAGDVFAYFISGAKERNPLAARELISALDG